MAQAVDQWALQADPARLALASLLQQRNLSDDAIAIDWRSVEAFYRRRDLRLAWNDSPADRDLALRFLGEAAGEGLSPGDYHVASLKAAPHNDAGQRARFDVLLTDALLHYAHDVRLGRVAARDIDPDVDLPAQNFDAVGTIASALETNRLEGTLAALPPSDERYAQLRSALARYRALASDGGWPRLPDVKKIGFDGDDPNVAALAARLRDEGDASANETDPGALRVAVMAFQRSHGLDADGRVGAVTMRALNVSAADRIAQIEANMERWRWLPRTWETRRIEVNVPDASLRVWDGAAQLLTSRIIVGKKDRPTPMFRTVATTVTVNPPWDVPVDIARKEILPKLVRDPGYLSAHHMVLLKPGVVRQLPGADNALGQLKLEMPNRFSVYLHDTPARTLFARTDRDLSHGCMRVEQILPLASIALTGDAAKGLDQLKQAIAAGSTQHISLPTPLPVYVLYWTVWVDADGSVAFRSDLYGRDQRLIAALTGGAGTRYAMLATAACQPACG
jgi:L,D-transpeptidase YcbB